MSNYSEVKGMTRRFSTSPMHGSKTRFFAFAHGDQLAVLDFSTGRVRIGSDIENIFDETGIIYIDNGVRLPGVEPIARTWEEMKEKIKRQWLEQLISKQPKIEVVFPPSNRTPEEELERTQKILDFDKPKGNPDTVGDLSAHAARKEEEARRWAHNAVNQDPNITVGDLTPAHDNRGLDELFVGRPTHRPPVTESQKLLEAKYENDAKAADVRFRVQNPSIREEALDAEHLVPKIKATLAEAEKQREKQRKEEAWRDIEERLRAKGIHI